MMQNWSIYLDALVSGIKKFLKWVAVFILVVIAIGFVKAFWPSEPEAPLTTAQRAAEEAKQKEWVAYKKLQDEGIKRGAIMAAALKKTARNPDSFRLENAQLIEGSGAICFTYRAQNGFGGMNIGYAVLSADGKDFKIQEQDGNAFVKLWNKECTRIGYDETENIRLLMSRVEN
jgi:hypothetical protein